MGEPRLVRASASQEDPDTPAGRRAAERVAPRRPLPCVVRSPDGTPFCAGLVEEISPAGVRLLLSRPFGIGILITVEFLGLQAWCGQRVLRIAHLTERAGGIRVE